MTDIDKFRAVVDVRDGNGTPIWYWNSGDVIQLDEHKDIVAEKDARIATLAAALRELLDSILAQYPPYESGKAAQDAWSDRRAKARNDAAFLLAQSETPPEFDPAWVCGVCGKRHGKGECLGAETKVDDCCPKCDSEICICGLGSEPAGSEPKITGKP